MSFHAKAARAYASVGKADDAREAAKLAARFPTKPKPLCPTCNLPTLVRVGTETVCYHCANEGN